MRRTVIPVIAGCGLAVAATALAAEQTVYQCTQGGLTRTVEVIRDPAASPVCEVWYAKPQESATRQRLWAAQGDPDYCGNQAQAFVEKLTGWGWACAIANAETAAPEAPEAPEAEDAAGETSVPAQPTDQPAE